MGPTPFGVGYLTKPSLTNPKAEVLQWGQRLSALDTRRSPAQRNPQNHASMGPTPFSVGYRSRDARPGNEGLASMGPTPFSVGYELIKRIKQVVPATLQWGQRHSALDTGLLVKSFNGGEMGFNGANAFQRWIHIAHTAEFERINMLQWGQRLSALDTGIAETWYECGYYALQWGQRLSALDTFGSVGSGGKLYVLQWGQRLSTLDTRPRRGPRADSRDASMGPTPFSVGYAPGRSTPSATTPRFNGANAFQRRIPLTVAQAKATFVGLQWGQRLLALDTSR